jgi:hypothetical protein
MIQNPRKDPRKPRMPPSCSLFVILARDAPVGVIFRRGPTIWTQVIRWNTATDTFDAGQWFKGRIYERRCDLSPSGEKLIYFGAKHHLVHRVDSSYPDSWTAISKVPYLTALALWPNIGTYHGGGLFASENEIWLNSVHYRWSNPKRDLPAQPHPKHVPPPELQCTPACFTGGDQLFPLRLVRDGWRLMTPGDVHEDGSVTEGRLVRWSKNQRFRLQLDFDYQKAKHSLIDTMAKPPETDVLDGANWADFDHDGRLVFARDGKLFRICLDRRSDIQLIADFYDRKPNRLIAPAWACKW